MAEVNGVKFYTFYYTATQKHSIASRYSTTRVDQRPGQSNYPFQWTEKGWLGPDNQVYPEH